MPKGLVSLVDLRRFSRVPLEQPLLFALKGEDSFVDGAAQDVSLGGMYIATELPAPFHSEIVVHVQIPGTVSELVLPAIVRWTRADGMGVQFGLLGARETYAITEYVRLSGSIASARVRGVGPTGR